VKNVQRGRGEHAAIVREADRDRLILQGIKRLRTGPRGLWKALFATHPGPPRVAIGLQAYEEMALKQMEELAARALAE